MLLRIDSTNGVPLYLQIAKEVKHSIAIGSLKPGEQIPSVREIALQITVNPNTVAKAYRELESQGIVETKRGTGTFVSKTIVDITQEERQKIISELMDRAIDEARHLQMSEDEMTNLLLERVQAFKRTRKEQEVRDE
jgi:GntR family transcriptional regulator